MYNVHRARGRLCPGYARAALRLRAFQQQQQHQTMELLLRPDVSCVSCVRHRAVQAAPSQMGEPETDRGGGAARTLGISMEILGTIATKKSTPSSPTWPQSGERARMMILTGATACLGKVRKGGPASAAFGLFDGMPKTPNVANSKPLTSSGPIKVRGSE